MSLSNGRNEAMIQVFLKDVCNPVLLSRDMDD
jgi:hypothetical protein